MYYLRDIASRLVVSTLVLFAILLTILCVANAETHLQILRELVPHPEAQKCFNAKNATLNNAFGGTIHGTRVWIEQYDRDGDSKIDMELAYEFYAGMKLRPFATYYVLDTNQDGEQDSLYMDIQGNGRCADMIEVPIGSEFTGKRL